jgi:hypothetical protein
MYQLFGFAWTLHHLPSVKVSFVGYAPFFEAHPRIISSWWNIHHLQSPLKISN